MAPGSPPSSTTQSKSQKVSPQYTLERVRNNQRQHRARRRAYIETLEKKLGEAEQTVLALRNQVEALQAEHTQCHHLNVADWRTPPEPWPQPHDDTSPSSICGTHGTTFRVPGSLPDMTDLGALTLHAPPPTNLLIGLPVGLGPRSERDAAIPVPVDGAENSRIILPLPQSHEGVAGSLLAIGSISTSSSRYAPDVTFSTTSYQAALGTETQLPATATSDCCSCGSSSNPLNVDALDEMAVVRNHESPLLMPDYVFQSAMEAYFKASADSESTMLCSVAYPLISQQNFKGISQEDVATWLWNGFRKSLQPGWGCRVKTDILFSLLAFISDG